MEAAPEDKIRTRSAELIIIPAPQDGVGLMDQLPWVSDTDQDFELARSSVETLNIAVENYHGSAVIEEYERRLTGGETGVRARIYKYK